jgi:hypothetical protein
LWYSFVLLDRRVSDRVRGSVCDHVGYKSGTVLVYSYALTGPAALYAPERLRLTLFLTDLGTHSISRSFPLPPQRILASLLLTSSFPLPPQHALGEVGTLVQALMSAFPTVPPLPRAPTPASAAPRPAAQTPGGAPYAVSPD